VPRPSRFALAAAVAALANTHAALAQPADTTATHHAGWVGMHDALTLGEFGVASAALLPLDRRVESAFRGPSAQRSAFLQNGAHALNFAGGAGTVLAASALFGVGRLAGSPMLARAGLHAGEAIVLGASATALMKTAIGRQRPNVESGDADDFVPGRGFRGNHGSLPSGHTMAAFAFASTVSAEVRRDHPRLGAVVGPILYTGAALVGGARMYDDQHWASDVVMGAGIGLVAGRVTTAFGQAHARGWLEGLAGRSAPR
jgi:membrane-associated phospholipid phosphatase